MIIPILVLLAAAWLFCDRMRIWHLAESVYWGQAAEMVGVMPGTDDYFWPLLQWTIENRPTVSEQLAGWKSPADRRAASQVGA